MNRYSTLQRRTPLRAKKAWNPERKPIATYTPLTAKKRIRKVGRVGKANIAARKEIAKHAEKMNLKRCEIALPGCTETWPLAPAHRHKRAFYKGDAEKLADPKQWIAACTNCHDQIEHNAELTEQIFMKLRGNE
jgi:hypothetical protein